MSSLRALMIELALGVVGLGGARDRAAYLRLIAPGEPEPVAHALGEASGCALVVRGLLLACGLRPELLMKRPIYDASSNRCPAVTPAILSLATEARAMREGSLVPPELGDILVMNSYRAEAISAPFTRVHLAIAVPHPPRAVARGASGGDGATFVRVTSVDGGERDGLGGRGPQLISRKMRIFHAVRSGPPVSINGPLSHVIDLDALGAHWGTTT